MLNALKHYHYLCVKRELLSTCSCVPISFTNMSLRRSAVIIYTFIFVTKKYLICGLWLAVLWICITPHYLSTQAHSVKVLGWLADRRKDRDNGKQWNQCHIKYTQIAMLYTEKLMIYNEEKKNAHEIIVLCSYLIYVIFNDIFGNYECNFH